MKTLYTRIVIVYIITVIVSLIFGFFMIGFLVQSRFGEEQKELLIKQGKGFISLSEKFDDFSEINNLANDLFIPMYVNFAIYDSKGLTEVIGTTKRSIPEKRIQQVLNGNVYREDGDDLNNPIVGIPFQKDTKHYALFVYLSEADGIEKRAYQVVLLGFLCVLISGSILILIVSRFIVKPLTKMTKATQELAKGNFDIQLHSKRKDEIGVLARNFDMMAEDLQEIEQMRKNFISDVSHEIQSPLTTIRGFSRALREKELPVAERLEFLQIIESESERLSRLSSHLLRLASLESNQHPFEPKRFSLDEQIRTVILNLKPEWSKKQLRFTVDLPKTYIVADEDLLHQVWQNMIHNSIKYNKNGGTIGVRIKKKSLTIIIEIEDTGIGIEEEHQRKIFERFYKVEHSRTKKNGSGIGLSIVKKIVELHHGDICVTSKPGEGSRFTITLPVKQ
ncbi:HAMP domain-containing sensor histidine kinase [Caldifermentibacillus hisashii]|uniref:HAMP domain-containing sensor histidine kinase n=1 Tax=Caldifermentibacillus hisashii TaxID=996558 RepID=UPI002E1D4CF0|nr:HAMP domain-containing sensor histidine kinase [Caldifermentibacillus hisashii]